ncbi:mediator of RNA polymerase II transcription subunit 12-like [Uranotaenia lowii]|uniref:mediator of RNA polymerase II transcription subunit 12-like n=1 Tax=Uranotaenia lowii TaxID=190385 RepID=UPI00247A6155|nr:mediator of RNA polymerase II transcription subunit 12-like [Uranotaenia lowii]XP_055614718.1 mediator of RNA polymerase II transcription subunit 12-like [Uranotaenia lowii]XP_055614719.1 mediator of RNA polymerase II transcription subunit 12-like [Uranotaenia lowii]
MRLQKTWLLTAGLAVLLAVSVEAQQQRRLRVRPRVLQQQQQLQQDSLEINSAEEEDSRAQQAVQYYRAQARQDVEDPRQLVLVAASEEDYNGQYGAPAARARADNARQVVRVTTAAPLAARQKVQEARPPPVQTIRNYNKVNDDGSFTFGYEAADGSFKEETRGTDCVVRGKYGYIDPDGNKREFTYVSGNPCDPNNPEGSEEDEEKSVEESDENVPQNYPRRPVAPRPTPRPNPTTPRPTTTVFQNTFSTGYNQQEESDEEVQIGQRARPAARPFTNQQPQTVTQRPRVQVVSTTPNTGFHTPTQTIPVNITPKPIYRVPAQNTLQAQPPATTYRPQTEVTTSIGSGFISTTKGNTILGGNRAPLDFDAEFKKFQQENKVGSTSAKPALTSSKPSSGNPIYQTQLVFNPQTGEYDTALYQQLPQSEGDFQLNHRLQPFVQHQPLHQQPQHLVSLEQLQQQSPLYRNSAPVAPAAPQPAPQVPQQLYQRQQNELQFVNSQQLFAQQLELQQSQLRQDRLEAARKTQSQQQQQQHRFQASSPQVHRVPQPQQQYYFIQPQQGHASSGQIDAFLRGHNIEY